MILAIDPGPVESAYVVLDDELRPIKFGKVENEVLRDDLNMDRFHSPEAIIEHFAIEMVASYGMPVGKEVFETCVWIGRFWENANFQHLERVYRKTDVCMNLCHSTKAKDSNVRQALIDRFAKHDFKNGKGTIKNPDWFHGFSKDIWQAYAVGVTYHDLYLKQD